MKYPLIALPLSALLILTGCGGSGSGGDDAPTSPAPVPTPAPTVTVSAPATAVATVEFNVAWTSTNATSCSSEFSTSTDASGSQAITATEAGTTTYSVTCTGPGGSATGSAAVDIAALASPQGLWQGTAIDDSSNSRTFGGVVTAENQYWLVYNGLNANAADPAGFVMGPGLASASGTEGGTFSASDLVEFNFEGKGSAVGELAASFTAQDTLDGTVVSSLSNMSGTQAYEIDGVTGADGLGATLVNTPDPVTFNDGGTALGIVPNINDPSGTPGLTGQFHFTNYRINMSIPLDPSNPSEVQINYPNRVLTIAQGTDYAAVFDDTTDPTHPTLLLTGIEFQDSITSPDCTDNGGGAFCGFIPSTVAHGDILITFDDATLASYTGIAHAYQEVNVPGIIDPVAGGTCLSDTYGIPANPSDANVNACAVAELTFAGQIPVSASSESTQTFTTTYNPAYDTAASLTNLAGNFSGNAGVGSSLEANSTLDIAADGTITGTTATSGCDITGTAAPHGDKNVYDVTNLAFVDNGGSTCTLAGVTFTGVATYDAGVGTVTVTAVNDAKSKGFLFVGSKVQ